MNNNSGEELRWIRRSRVTVKGLKMMHLGRGRRGGRMGRGIEGGEWEKKKGDMEKMRKREIGSEERGEKEGES